MIIRFENRYPIHFVQHRFCLCDRGLLILDENKCFEAKGLENVWT
jgi:hypothetical protein